VPDGLADWGDFPNTVLHFLSLPPVMVDLRHELDRSVRFQLYGLGFEREFGIVSAYNPMGIGQAASINSERAASLQMEAAALPATAICRVDACSPDRSHCEMSVALALDLHSLVDLACRYHQLAIFWFDGEAFWIIPARSGNAKLRLPVPA
jgi:hypothetical protein